jgi:serine phosphatase RsbU (regulator of sigma subunit)/pSer/pThr/pTyr-binding forkhead associated (FHA) protein
MLRDDQPRLLLTDADGTRTYPLLHFPFRIGRSGDSDLCMTHAQISRQHACIEAEPDGLYLRDLGSRHGTLRNGERIERVRLRSGDRIAPGQSSVTLVFLDGPTQEETGTTAKHDSGTSARDLLERASGQVSGSDLEKLSLFLEAAQRFNGTQVLEEVLSTMIEYALRLTCAERGFVFLGDDVASLRLRTGRASDGSVLHDDSKISRSIVRDAAHSGLDYILGDATGEGATIGRDSIIAHDLRSVIAIPLRWRSTGTLLGLLYLDSRLQSCNLSTVSREILRAIATEAATLVENARMLEAEQASALLRKEMEIAASIQQRIISCDLPSVPGYALSARTLPCTEVGGDFYDVIQTEDGCVAIVADVSGKGMSAALLASIVHGMMYAQVTSGASLVDAISAVHAFLCARVSGTKYVTLVAVRCRQDGSAELVNGGHVPPLLVGADGRIHPIEEGDMPVGMLDFATFHAVPITLLPGTRIVLLSDGVSEAENPAGEQFTVSHFAQYLTVQNPIGAIFGAVDRFSEGVPQADDRTMLTIDRLNLPDMRV